MRGELLHQRKRPLPETRYIKPTGHSSGKIWECKKKVQNVNCRYCRKKFPYRMNSKAPVCPKCEEYIRKFGKPKTCVYCKIQAAFIGSKCKRCTNSETEFGEPRCCEICKQKCAFGPKSTDKKVEARRQCSLCSISLQRATMKTKANDSGCRPTGNPREHVVEKMRQKPTSKENDLKKRPNSPGVSKSLGEEPQEKKMKASTSGSDLDVASELQRIKDLNEQVSILREQLSKKESQLSIKEKEITELKKNKVTAEMEMKSEVEKAKSIHESRVETLQSKIRHLTDELSDLQKNKRKKNPVSSTPVEPVSLQVLDKPRPRVKA